MFDKPDMPPGQAKKLEDHVAAVKRWVFAGSPAPCGAIDEIVRIAQAFDRTHASNLDIGYIADDIVEVIWRACDSPEIIVPLRPQPEPVPPVEPPTTMG